MKPLTLRLAADRLFAIALTLVAIGEFLPARQTLALERRPLEPPAMNRSSQEISWAMATANSLLLISGDPSDASPDAASPEQPTPVAPAPASEAETRDREDFPWWLLLVPLMGGSLWGWQKGRRAQGEQSSPLPAPPNPSEAPTGASSASMVGSGSWEDAIGLEAQGSTPAIAPALEELSDRNPPLRPPGDPEGQNLPLAADLVFTETAPPERGVRASRADTALAGIRSTFPDPSSLGWLCLIPRLQTIDALWELPDVRRAEAAAAGRQRMLLRLLDVTGIAHDRLNSQTPHRIQQFECEASASDLSIPIAVADRDYLAELGYVTADGRWRRLLRSEPVRGAYPEEEESEGAIAATGTDRSDSDLAAWPSPTTIVADSRLVLTSHRLDQVFAHWEVPAVSHAVLQHRGGQQFQLRIYDVTDPKAFPLEELSHLTLNHPQVSSIQVFDCDPTTQSYPLTTLTVERDYMGEIGYGTADDRWLRLAQSAPIRLQVTVPEAVRLSESFTVPTNLPISGETMAPAAVSEAVMEAPGAGQSDSLNDETTRSKINAGIGKGINLSINQQTSDALGF